MTATDSKRASEAAQFAERTPPAPAPVTPSGIEVPELVSADMLSARELEPPGQFPFTRGIFPDGYRGRLWTFRQYSGFGTAEETNARYRFLLESGSTGLSVALDLPTQCGYDPDDPMAVGEIGKVGVSMFSLAEAETVFQGIDLARISTSFTINGTAAIVYAMYLAVADKAGTPRAKLTGTIQNDILKEYVARGTWIFPVRPSMRLIADTVLYANRETPRFNPISIAGAHVRDAGCTAVEEMAYTLANGLAYVDELLRHGGDANDFARRLSFFFYVHMDVFEEIAKFRAGRRLWAKMLQARYGVTDPKALMFRFGVVCGGSSLTSQQPYNNITRVGVETMAAVLSGAQSIFTCAYDEAFQIPTEFSAEIALRTQQIVAYESGVSKTVDPLGGSYYVEWLTDRTEEQIAAIIKELDDYGGVERAIEDGYLQARIARRALERKRRKDSGETVVVGETHFTRDGESATDYGEVFTLNPAVAASIGARLAKLRAGRDQGAVDAALGRLEAAARRPDANVMPYLVECCHAYATVGEMVARLKACWGEFQEPIGL
jgi:methylmalonyl-CoA mutase N-terminal domain/subunit